MEIKVRGRLGNDPELKASQNGTNYCSFSVAHTPRKKVNNEWVDGETQWYRVVMFDKKAMQAATLKKGDEVLIFGTVKMSSFKGKDGTEKTALEITGSEIYSAIKTKQTQAQSQEGWTANPW